MAGSARDVSDLAHHVLELMAAHHGEPDGAQYDLDHPHGIDLVLGIGIEAGYATLGRIGFEGRFDYGALGPATNLAARLCSHASPGQTLIGQRVFAATEEAVETAPVRSLELKGFGRPVVAYEVRQLRCG